MIPNSSLKTLLNPPMENCKEVASDVITDAITDVINEADQTTLNQLSDKIHTRRQELNMQIHNDSVSEIHDFFFYRW
jgi:hypothetical protein